MKQRENKRFKVKSGSFAQLRSKSKKLLTIFNISRSGMALNCIDYKLQSDHTFKLDILFADDAFYVESVPVNVVWDYEIAANIPQKTFSMRVFGLQINELTVRQAALMKYFISNYTLDDGEVMPNLCERDNHIFNNTPQVAGLLQNDTILERRINCNYG